ncbi:hypothetical protein BDV59DRAFT_160801 [Aspergillus ambiguus]|uniref:uncharacterized protein n=1 Tax=Aspergillus ambiguus TaxID=176160 RepID=UPI003CCD2FEA
MVGQTITLWQGPPCNKREVSAQIVQIFEPFTTYCTMLLNFISSPGPQGAVVLKLFDRRFATKLGRDHGICPWFRALDVEYFRFVTSGGALEFLTRLDNSEGEPFNAAQNEAFLHQLMWSRFRTEVEAYDLMKDLQGECVPRQLESVTFPGYYVSCGESVDRFFKIPGILFEYIHGFPLRLVSGNAPRDTWQSICEEAIRVVHLIGDRGILNEDVKTRSFNVREEPGPKFKVFMLDFALCSFRHQYRDEAHWRESKAKHDEEGAVGVDLQRYLQGAFVYRRSDRYKALDEEFMEAG